MSGRPASGDGGTREYRDGTDEYHHHPGDRDPVSSKKAGEAPEPPRKEPPWWERAGFSSLADALAEGEAARDRVMGRKPRDLRGLSLEEVIFSEPERPPKVRRRRTRERQVNVKLTGEEHERLVDAARRYGVATATLARVFVIRATDVALKRDGA